MPKRNRRKRVLLALGWYSYRLHRGVARYADQARWILNIEMERTGLLPPYWDGDGAICVLGMNKKQDRELLSLNIPVVSIGPVIQPGVPRVFPDNEMIGQQAAEHFLTRGFKHFSYYICSGGPSEEIRDPNLNAHCVDTMWIFTSLTGPPSRMTNVPTAKPE